MKFLLVAVALAYCAYGTQTPPSAPKDELAKRIRKNPKEASGGSEEKAGRHAIKNYVKKIRVPEGLHAKMQDAVKSMCNIGDQYKWQDLPKLPKDGRSDAQTHFIQQGSVFISANAETGSILLNRGSTGNDELHRWAKQILKENGLESRIEAIEQVGLMVTSLVSGEAPSISSEYPKSCRGGTEHYWHQDGTNSLVGGNGSDTLESSDLETLVLVYVTLGNHNQGTSVRRGDNSLCYTLSAKEGEGVAIKDAHLLHSLPKLEPADPNKPLVRALFRIRINAKEEANAHMDSKRRKPTIINCCNGPECTLHNIGMPVGELDYLCRDCQGNGVAAGRGMSSHLMDRRLAY